mmetsp:Transcript_7618/g.13184  ORF Transcript_7618/g.13184 Transcript_7618/m.13184 type:complete len:126 (+) Transcript_7618:230-607(+)|eukprot:CAMPEP_0119103966 /NCGR_PEP_ID=MMETSP1180-20130426/2297_1 /TAXON_ID=3052 ORGANISM="Chlamydomonas cf sp, Strain CCMP681" /NCGR_SAMPLE_ID=MMETSP1180 /ASSEMBLY_ACC=CAM_ASM_000741 /LENGTH=125 /DNA_ID=CAMNT_0007088599 /DNA_START=189 /DNA_END=566 /DNA_ORIENTATION=+
MLKHLKRVYVSFVPGDPKSVSARELLQRLNGDKSRKSNPACKVEFKVNEEAPEGSSYVELQFADDEKRKVALAAVTVDEVTSMIEQKGNEMELRAVFKEVGFDPWNAANRLGPAAAATGSQSEVK